MQLRNMYIYCHISICYYVIILNHGYKHSIIIYYNYFHWYEQLALSEWHFMSYITELS